MRTSPFWLVSSKGALPAHKHESALGCAARGAAMSLALEPLHRALNGHGFSENHLFAAHQATHKRTLTTGTRAEGRIGVTLARNYCQASTVTNNSWSGSYRWSRAPPFHARYITRPHAILRVQRRPASDVAFKPHHPSYCIACLNRLNLPVCHPH